MDVNKSVSSLTLSADLANGAKLWQRSVLGCITFPCTVQWLCFSYITMDWTWVQISHQLWVMISELVDYIGITHCVLWYCLRPRYITVSSVTLLKEHFTAEQSSLYCVKIYPFLLCHCTEWAHMIFRRTDLPAACNCYDWISLKWDSREAIKTITWIELALRGV